MGVNVQRKMYLQALKYLLYRKKISIYRKQEQDYIALAAIILAGVAGRMQLLITFIF
jgi:hypothetical protein